MHLSSYVSLLHRAQQNLASAFRQVAEHHVQEPDVYGICRLLADQCDQHVKKLLPFLNRYGEEREPENLHSDLFKGTRSGGLGLVRDLQDLYVMASEVDISWTMIGQAAQGIRDKDLLTVVQACEGETVNQLNWLTTRMKHAAPQALIVSS